MLCSAVHSIVMSCQPAPVHYRRWDTCHERGVRLTSGDPNYANQNPSNIGMTGTQETSGTGQATQSANEIADQTKQAAAQVTGEAKQAARSQLATRKDQTAQGLNVVSSAISDMGDKLRQNDQTSSYAGFMDQAANQVKRAAGYLQNHDVQQIVGAAEDWARRDPALALGGAFVLGLVAARFLKSSGVQGRSSHSQGRGYNPASRYNYQYYRQPDQYGYNPRSGTTYRPSGRFWSEPEGIGTESVDGVDTRESRY